VETVIQNLECLEDVTPVLSFVVQALIDHIHNLIKLGGCVVCHLSDLAHLSTRRAPWVITGGFSNLDLGARITLGHVFDASHYLGHDGRFVICTVGSRTGGLIGKVGMLREHQSIGRDGVSLGDSARLGDNDRNVQAFRATVYATRTRDARP
jgi:hypothetical protein